MAEELSRIGIAVDSKQAENSLNNIKNQLRSTAKDVKLFDEYWDKLNSTLYSAASGFTSDNALLKQMATGVKETAQGINQLNATLNSYFQGATKVYKATKKVVDEQRQMTKTMNDMAKQANRFNFGNINAQLQDIAVTAAMNMNPLTIGLQQGTQLVYVLQQSKAPLADFVVGLKSLISPLSLVVVGLTAVIAALIQWVNWGKIGKTILEGLAKSFEAIGLIQISKWFESLADSSDKAWVSIKKLLDLTQGFNDEMNDLANKNFILETELYNPDKLTSKDLKEEIYSLEKYYELSKKLEDEKRKFINENFEKKDYNELLGNYMEEYNESKKAIEGQARDYAKLKIENENLQEKINERNKKEKEALALTRKQVEEFDKLAKSYDDIFIKQSDKYENMQFEESIKGLSTYEKTYQTVSRDMTKDVEKLRQQAVAAGIPMSKINEMYADSEGRIKATAEAQADLTARIEESTMAEEEFNEFVRTAQSETSTFFKDMRHGLRDGQSAWEAFGNAVNNVLDKILDKMIDIGVEAAFSGLGSNTGGKGNSFLGTLFTAGKSLFGGITGGNSTAGAFEAAGGAGKIGVKPAMAANGGVFSNGIYSSPTVFKFAKGGKFGVMGEAGPEAVMPLRRSPDGSLGVKADGIGGSNVVVNVINNSNAQARTEQRQTAQGMEIDVMIDELVGEKLGRPGTSSNTALRAYNNRQLITR